jgi:type IV pilus assembly protein PilX
MNMQYYIPVRQRGMVLITSLLLLLVATILAVSMFRSFGTQEKIAGNLREKARALHAAETAQQYAEWSLVNQKAGSKGNCTGIVDSSVPQYCVNAPTFNVTSSTWTVGVTYLPPDPSTGLNMNVTTTSGPGTYYYKPIYYITDLGAGGGGEIFQIDAMGVGGSSFNNVPNAVAVVESTYLVTGNAGYCTDPVTCTGPTTPTGTGANATGGAASGT